MSILVGEESKVVVWGLTGREGSFHGVQNRAYGTQVVAGVTPGKGGASVEGIPVFGTGAEAAEETGADVALLFVPARFAADAIYEAADAGFKLVVVVTEGIPVSDTLKAHHYLRTRGVRMVGPNCPGIISPGRCNVGIMPPGVFSSGRVGVVSRSGTLTYQIASDLASRGLGVSTAVGIGGDPVVGTGFSDVLELFEEDPETNLVVMIGEIGGSEEEIAAHRWKDHLTIPVVGYIAGFTAPEGRQMGHAGAIINGSAGTASAKKLALESVGIAVGRSPAEVAALVQAQLPAE